MLRKIFKIDKDGKRSDEEEEEGEGNEDEDEGGDGNEDELEDEGSDGEVGASNL